MNIKILILFSIILLSGCAKDNLTLNASNKVNLEGKTLVVNYGQIQTHPVINTQLDAISKGITMGITGINLGTISNSTLDSNTNHAVTLDIAPIISIGEAIIPKFINKYNMKKIEEVAQDNLDPLTDAADEDLNIEMKLFHANYSADYILDIATSWQVMFYKTLWDKYYVKMYNKLRLIDRKKKVVISSTICDYESNFKDKIPSYKAMFKNNAKLMKEESKKAINECIPYIETNILK